MRGGDIRRIVIHLSCLDSNQIIELYEYLANQHPGIGGRIIKIQSMYRGFITRKHIEDEKKLHVLLHLKNVGCFDESLRSISLTLRSPS